MNTRTLILTAALGAALALPTAAHAAFPGTNGFIYYANGTDLWRANADGSGQTPIVATGNVENFPSASADGRVSYQGGAGIDIFVANSDGSGQLNITNNGAGVVEEETAFSPNGSRVAFRRNLANFEIVSALAGGGGGEVNVTNTADNEQHPVYSPSGARIAYHSQVTGAGDIYSKSADGSGAQLQLTNSPARDDTPDYSPDGSRIVFRNDAAGGGDLFTAPANALGAPTALAGANDPVAQESQPVYSPDGTKILFQTNRTGGQFDIWVANADGSGAAPLITGAGDQTVPSWAPVPPAPGPSTGAGAEPDPVRQAGRPAAPRFDGRKRVRIGSDGTFEWSFSATPGLNGKATFTTVNAVRAQATAKRKKRSRSKRLTVGSKTFTVPASGKVLLKVKVSSKVLDVLRKRKNLPVRAAVSLTNPAGTTQANTVIKLRAPKAKKRRGRR